MRNPQPALDLLVSLPSENKTVLRDWWVSVEGGEYGDDIKDYPELWEDEWELPDGLQDLSSEDWVSIGHWAGGDHPLNLNAIAIGLGLEQIRYQPEQFNGLVYEPSAHSGIVYSFYETAVAIGDSNGEASKALDDFIETLEDLGLTDDITAEVETKKVREIIS